MTIISSLPVHLLTNRIEVSDVSNYLLRNCRFDDICSDYIWCWSAMVRRICRRKCKRAVYDRWNICWFVNRGRRWMDSRWRTQRIFAQIWTRCVAQQDTRTYLNICQVSIMLFSSPLSSLPESSSLQIITKTVTYSGHCAAAAAGHMVSS